MVQVNVYTLEWEIVRTYWAATRPAGCAYAGAFVQVGQHFHKCLD